MTPGMGRRCFENVCRVERFYSRGRQQSNEYRGEVGNNRQPRMEGDFPLLSFISVASRDRG